MGLLSHEMAKELIEKAFAATEDGGSVHFLFQGGEPTLAGLDFFRFFLERSVPCSAISLCPQHPDQLAFVWMKSGLPFLKPTLSS